MLTLAYLANEFPSRVEPYVVDEIAELRSRGIRVITASVRRPAKDIMAPPQIILQPVKPSLLPSVLWLLVARWRRIAPLLLRILLSGRETLWQRAKALVHTFLGVCYAVRLRGHGVDHIHVHHGYFGSWIAMTAASVLGASFSMTLHGSDLLLHGTYLDAKLANCKFCFTVSEYNRKAILDRWPELDQGKIILSRLGVEIPLCEISTTTREGEYLKLLAVGRLHTVKDHAFLVRACTELRTRGVQFRCQIAGEGPERGSLESLIRELRLQNCVTLLGHIEREALGSLYEQADAVVLTSRSEGIPLVLMEAMARGRIVVAPAITGIPELITTGETGFLYQPGQLNDCVAHLQFVDWLIRAWRRSQESKDSSPEAARYLMRIRRKAVDHVVQNFNREKNLERFGDLFIERT
ncbi:MAG TPA: glycosyltransferase family 4 protein, partial [Candidatus Sulfotelmatobacter sp.]|nr:glycosyltransferase family 4 protein [Candidatus Sulfotelmatobacter sp.]